MVPGRVVGGKTHPSRYVYDGKGGFRSIMHPYRMDPCPQGSHSRGISYFHGGPCPEGTRAGRSMGPWVYGDGTEGSTLSRGLHGGGGPSHHIILWWQRWYGLTVVVMTISALGMFNCIYFFFVGGD